MRIGRFVGNYSMNKFMSPLEWHMIFDHLAKLIDAYLKKPKTKRPNDSIDLADTNIALNVEWSEIDPAFYGKMFPAINFEMVYPFVMVVNVVCKSNMDKFMPTAGKGSSQFANIVNSPNITLSVRTKAKTSTTKTQTANASAPNSPVAATSNTKAFTPNSPKKSASLAVASKSVTVGAIVDLTLSKRNGSNASVAANGTRPFTIPLYRLTIDEIDRLTGSTSVTVPTDGRKKRKHQSLNDSVSTPQKEMPAKRPAPETPFVNSVNSTPYVRLSKIEPEPIETDVSRILAENDQPTGTKAGPKSSKTKKVKNNTNNKNRLAKTPLSSKRSGTKTAKKLAKPRLQVSISHLTAKPKKSSKVKKATQKAKKGNSKLVNGESMLIEIVEGNASDPFQQPSTSRASNNKENHRPEPQSNGNTQPMFVRISLNSLLCLAHIRNYLFFLFFSLFIL